MRSSTFLAAAGVSISLAFLPGAALATCKNGICAVSHEEGNRLYIDFSNQLKGVTHYNFSVPNHDQVEMGINQTETFITIPQNRPVTVHYAFQACSGGGFLSTSNCTPWANFSHTAQ